MTALKRWLRKFLELDTSEVPAPIAEPKRESIRINSEALALAGMQQDSAGERLSVAQFAERAFKAAQPLPGVFPKGQKLAMDSAINDAINFASTNAIFAEGLQFMGYPYLAELTQRPEYRRPAEILAKEMTRNWIKLTATGKKDKTEKLKELEVELERLKIQELFSKSVEQDGFFGRSQIYIDIGVDPDDRDEMKAPMLDNPSKIEKKPIERLTMIEPIWTYPNFYNANDPLDKTFFKPQTWFVMGKEIHTTRFLTFVSREVPDILKPAYAFGGISLSQMGKPYVDNWLRTRQSVSDLVHSFSVMVLKTDMSSILNMGLGEQVFHRLSLFNKFRDNRGAFAIDKTTEDFSNVAAPISGLDHLQAQSQEHMSAVYGIPLMILFGLSPSGLNVSTEGETRTFQDWIAGKQKSDLRPNLTRIINIVQLTLWGEIDPEIGFAFNPLWTLDSVQQGNLDKTNADTAVAYIDRGVIDPGEQRAVLAAAKDSPYASLDLSKEIVPPDQAGAEAGIGEGLTPPDDAAKHAERD